MTLVAMRRMQSFVLAMGACALVVTMAAGAVADEPRHCEVLVDGARVQRGPQTIATLRKGHVYRVQEVVTGWIRVVPGPDRTASGYVRATEVKMLPIGAGGPGQSGLVPESFADARVSIDWAVGTFGLAATLPQAAGVENLAIVAPESLDPAERPTVKVNGANVELRGTAAGLVACLAPNTRSFWIAGTAGDEPIAFRIDLPGVVGLTEVETQKFPNFPEGLVLKVAVEGLLPGFVVDFAEVGSGPLLYSPVSSLKGSAPRVTDVVGRTGKAGVAIRVVVPYLTGETASRNYYVRVRNPDGSSTQHLLLVRTGEQFTATARTIGQPTAMLVDATVEAPDVEVLDAVEAAKRVTAAGLVPSHVDRYTLEPLKAPPAADALVTRQGTPPGERILAGSTLLLASDSGQSTPVLDDVPLAPAAVDASDGLGFARVGNGEPYRTPVDESQLISADSDTDQPPVSAVLPLEVDPGVSLDPTRPVEREGRAALLKQLLAALSRQPSGSELPGIVGKALAAGTAAGEEQFAAAVAAGEPVNPAAAGAVFSAVTRELKVNVSNAEGLAARDDWLRYIAGRRTAAWLDRNGNGQLADDSAAWAIGWLFEHDKFDPWTVTTITPSGDGGPPLATFPEQPQNAPDGGPNPQPNIDLKGLLGLLLPGKPNVIVPPSSQGGSKPPPPPTPPSGKPLVTKGDGPDFVRVPNSAPELLGEVQPRFHDLGLKIARAGELFQSDKVVASNPRPQTWVESGRTVELEVQRRVPDVIKASYADATATLNKWKLQPTTPGKSRPTDVVVEQEPVAGTYVSPLAEVALTLRLMAPDVLGREQADAVKLLGTYDLGWASDTKAFGNDKVVAQEPLAGELVDHGDRIKLTLHLVVPNVQGVALADARRTLQRWDLTPDVPNSLAHDIDIVRGQSPAPGTYVPHESRARLGPVVAKVPDVRGGSVGATQRRLENVEDFAVRRYGDLIDDDEITQQTPAPGTEMERGGTITLDGRVRVPNVQGQRIFAARGEVQAAKGRLEAVFDVPPGDDDLVWGQVPAAGTIVFPRSQVTLIPGVRVPRLYGLSPQDARNAVADAGLAVVRQSSSTRETGDRNLVGVSEVADQSPEPGLYRRDRVGGVELVYSTWILGIRTVPSVLIRHELGMPSLNAIATMERADLVPIIVYKRQEYTADQWRGFLAGQAIAGLIAGQANNQPIATGKTDPGEGSRVVIYSRVRILVVDGFGTSK